jgi:ectoine hydroxylase-related dioxygenase (phytanoyl-CoA dioxygenase family)
MTEHLPSASEKRRGLIDDGFCVFESILDLDMVERVTDASDRLLHRQDEEHFADNVSTGSMVCVWDDPFFSELIAWHPAMDAVRSMGFEQTVFSTGFVISKPPHSPPLFWHQDWWGWEHEHSYTAKPQQIFLMYYLVDTTPENGCLRLIPGSHLKRHPLHDLPEAHTEDIRMAGDLNHPVYLDQPGEVDVCVKAGDLVIGDSRLLHSARANQTDSRRTVITLWFHPQFYQLPEPMQALLGRRGGNANQRVTQWPEAAQERVRDLLPIYEGTTEPLNWNRTPGVMLK